LKGSPNALVDSPWLASLVSKNQELDESATTKEDVFRRSDTKVPAELPAKRWRLLNGSEIIPSVTQGTKFIDGIREDKVAA
jgi:hypothetical protein